VPLPLPTPRGASRRMLPYCLRGKSLGTARPELEADKPFTGDAVTAGFRGSKLPASRRLQSEISEVFAGPGRIQRGIGDSPSRIDLDAYADANDTPNRGERFLRSVRQNLIQDFAASGRWLGSPQCACGRKGFRARGCGDWGGDGRTVRWRRRVFLGGSLQRVLLRRWRRRFWSRRDFTARGLLDRF